MVFNYNEKRIINLLYVARRPLTTKQVANKTHMAWQTAKDYLTELQKKGYMNKSIQGNRTYWWLRT